MTPLIPDDRAAAQARATSSRLIEAADALVARGLDVPAEHRRVLEGVYGWWRLVNRTTAAVLLLTKQGFGSPEVAPLIRNILNHAYAINWLVDNGEPAIDAVIAYGYDRQDNMAKWLDITGWEIAHEYRAQLAQRTPQPSRTTAERKKHNRLVEELRNVASLFEAYGSSDVYPVYAHLSGQSHASVDTASAYLSRRDDGTIALLPAAEGLSEAAFIHLAVALIQAGLAVSPLLTGNPMSAALDEAITELGMQGTQFLPHRPR